MNRAGADAACDCHAHVFGPLDRFPFVKARSYTPPERLASAYRAMLDRIGIRRGVVVQPSVYGVDNRATLSAIAELGADFRGVAVLPPDVGDGDLASLDAGGITGVRITDLPGAAVSLDHLEAMADRLRGSRWHIQVFADFTRRTDLGDRIRRLGVPVVIDHLGMIPPQAGTADPAFATIVALLKDGLCWLKLSGPYLVSKQPPPYADMAPVAAGFVAAAPDRLVWASDWPHPAAGANPPDDADLLALLALWAPDPAVRKRILVDNPAKLYGFDRDDSAHSPAAGV